MITHAYKQCAYTFYVKIQVHRCPPSSYKYTCNTKGALSAILALCMCSLISISRACIAYQLMPTVYIACVEKIAKATYGTSESRTY